ncbi:putative nuclease HARBI1 [Mercenaria mercenaria]|uniref:putative nuclease HARBI1 n=1 Tax=Mercenaria mercenaria TaxID=6596 RepID=UPI00234E4FAB|nr:putative nuclease HARBI1 [Mercenaria mercenaria]
MEAQAVSVLQVCAVMDREMIEYAGDVVQLEVLQKEDRRRGIRRQRRWWVRDWLSRRSLYGHFDIHVQELRLEDPIAFRNFLRIDRETFQELLYHLEDHITKKTTRWRCAVSPGMKRALTLRFLATGDSYHSLMYGFRVAHNTISGIVVEVCQAIIDVFEAQVIRTPTEPKEWLEVAEQFATRWQFPHTLGALDGKHIAIKKPNKAGSTFFNYKGFHSIVLMALVIANYNFRWVQDGDVGSSSDAQIWNRCDLKEAVQAGVIGIPDPAPLSGDDRPMPYFLIGDDAFGMETWLMKPFARRGLSHEERIFNYRLSRAGRVVENAFGIFANCFRCLLQTLNLEINTVSQVGRACVCFHNFIRTRNPAQDNNLIDQEDEDHNLVPGAWRNYVNLEDMENIRGGNVDGREAKQQRIYLKHYMNSPAGSVPWQDRMVRLY